MFNLFQSQNDKRTAEQPGGQNPMLRQMLVSRLMGQGAPQPTNAAGGIAQGMGSIANGFALRNMNSGQQSPQNHHPLMGLFQGNSGGPRSFMSGLMDYARENPMQREINRGGSR